MEKTFVKEFVQDLVGSYQDDIEVSRLIDEHPQLLIQSHWDALNAMIYDIIVPKLESLKSPNEILQSFVEDAKRSWVNERTIQYCENLIRKFALNKLYLAMKWELITILESANEYDWVKISTLTQSQTLVIQQLFRLESFGHYNDIRNTLENKFLWK